MENFKIILRNSEKWNFILNESYLERNSYLIKEIAKPNDLIGFYYSKNKCSVCYSQFIFRNYERLISDEKT